MRFAKLENNFIVAFFLAYFDEIRLADAEGETITPVPLTDKNNHTALKPKEKIFLRYNTT